MSEMVVFKANELAVSRYDLTEHETKLILFCVAQLNPTIDNPTVEQRTVTFSCAEYAKFMGLSYENAWGRLNSSTKDLFKRSVELIYPTGDVSLRVFNWTEYAEFNRKKQTVTLVFSTYIQPLLFHLKKFIKYNLIHVKAFENKYSMRIYEWLLKELTQRNTHKANIEISIKEFKFMLMIDDKYTALNDFTKRILKPITKDLNTYSNMKLTIEKKGRPVDKLIFQCELDKQVDLVTELDIPLVQTPDSNTRTPIPETKHTPDNLLYNGLKKLLNEANISHIKLSKFEITFLNDMQGKYNLNGSFSWLTSKQRDKLEKILLRHRI
ncbi:TPA: replication initiation protein [Salmonella enterica]|uniref:Replication initiation protein n=1 Tax=Salmonella enterica TaxID=28901 RepID=A0A756I4P3_SALER|nr:replication initiation protein [Salmonella enterica]